MLAVAEVAADDGSPADLPAVLLLAVGSTVPLAAARRHLPAVAATITAATLLTLATGHRPTVGGLVAQLAVAVAVAGAAARRARSRTAVRAASRQAMEATLLEHATRGERARIARELHDVVAHHISMIAVQSEIARLATPGMPAQGAERLAAIGDTARTALNEMRRLLGLLREDAGAEPSREPQPGLEQLNQLIDQAREAGGASTRLIVRGGVAPLSPGIELTAYRIVQEALTNARRHAPGAAVSVAVAVDDSGARVVVANGPPDNGSGPASGRRVADSDRRDPRSGHGLAGMRERVQLTGGTLVAGPTGQGGWRVEARLPAPPPQDGRA
ncbi:MAG TPA: sensor histidine kinase [Actinomycetota bacterium]|nr:sensor histidine kinase [Actinomycetota bacterium]